MALKMRVLNVVGLEDISEMNSTIENDDLETSTVTRDETFEVIQQNKRMSVLMFCSLAFCVGLNLSTLTATGEYAAKRLGTSKFGVEILVNVAFMIHALFGIFMAFFVEQFGLKMTFVSNALLQILGGTATHIGLVHEQIGRCLAMVILGQLADGTAFALLLESIAKVSELWKGHVKMFGNALLLAALFLGISIKSMVFAITPAASVAVVLQRFAISRAAVASVLLIMILVAIKKRPCLCFQPSTQDVAHRKSALTWKNLANEVQISCMNMNLLLLKQAYAIYFAIAFTMMFLLHRGIENRFPKRHAILHWVEAGTALSGVIGLFCGAGLMKMKSNSKMVTVTLIFLSASLMGVFTFAATDIKSFPLCVLFIIGWGISGFAWLGIGVAHVTDLSRKTSASVVPTSCIVTGSFYTVIMTSVAGWTMNAFGFIFVGYFFTTLYVLSLLLVVASKNEKSWRECCSVETDQFLQDGTLPMTD
eukprot:Seg8062.1 transcript_id=Seg8062.1/GoldUCD/mRNA.D3Y31 product="Feline leukemia virus subgroup C receptor-related protein 2" protein_id=Seg8062.1/GoldUCD/D3Y31